MHSSGANHAQVICIGCYVASCQLFVDPNLLCDHFRYQHKTQRQNVELTALNGSPQTNRRRRGSFVHFFYSVYDTADHTIQLFSAFLCTLSDYFTILKYIVVVNM